MSRPNLTPDDLVITGLGMQSSLGKAKGACAAARAGISMPRELDFIVIDDDGNEETCIGHPVQAAAGFRGFGKLVTLAWAALSDLIDQTKLLALRDGKTAMIWAVPAPPESEITSKALGPAALSAKLAALASLDVTDGEWNRNVGDARGLGAALPAAVSVLREKRVARCIVGAVDSLLDDDRLEWLADSGRLKTSNQPDALRPGEGAAVMLLERFESAEERGAKPLAVLKGCAVADDPEEIPDTGAGIARAISQLVEETGPVVKTVWLVTDHNGESTRARDLGQGLIRLRAAYPSIADAPHWFPALSFGDTNVASSAVALCAATTALSRGYAPGDSVFVLANCGPRGRSAIRLERV